MAASPVAKSETTTPNPSAATPSSSNSNGVSKPSPVLSQTSPSIPGPNNPYGITTKQLPPFQLLGMGKRKRGRPRKEDSLRRMAECVAVEGAMGWKNNWRRNIPNKRRKLLPALHRPLQNSMSDQQNRMVQLECNVDINNFLNISMNEGGDIERKPNPVRDLNYFKSLSSNITDLSPSSLSELRKIVQGSLDRLRKSDALKAAKREEMERRRREEAKSEFEAKDKRIDVDVKIPPSVSIKAEPVDLPPDVFPENEQNSADDRISIVKVEGGSSSGEQPSEHEEGAEDDDEERGEHEEEHGEHEEEDDDVQGEQEEEEGDSESDNKDVAGESESDNKDGAGESESENKDGGQEENEPIENGEASSSIDSEEDADGGNEINGESES
ncbi:hypothetical protein GE061_005074 [Apolygus lucorum]|uniref:Uncharacterized protein n=1 Tax=Apolygus lucorum TaxID=248454 RepID=A0A8S9WX02_APOLU|nr:hypothetical protein GE061_005074 [Apolygus lucorum]